MNAPEVDRRTEEVLPEYMTEVRWMRKATLVLRHLDRHSLLEQSGRAVHPQATAKRGHRDANFVLEQVVKARTAQVRHPQQNINRWPGTLAAQESNYGHDALIADVPV